MLTYRTEGGWGKKYFSWTILDLLVSFLFTFHVLLLKEII
jgi:hypothetical protein